MEKELIVLAEGQENWEYAPDEPEPAPEESGSL
jgi:hypothetical protein